VKFGIGDFYKKIRRGYPKLGLNRAKNVWHLTQRPK